MHDEWAFLGFILMGGVITSFPLQISLYRHK